MLTTFSIDMIGHPVQLDIGCGGAAGFILHGAFSNPESDRLKLFVPVLNFFWERGATFTTLVVGPILGGIFVGTAANASGAQSLVGPLAEFAISLVPIANTVYHISRAYSTCSQGE